MTNAGYFTDQIASALRVAKSTINSDRNAMAGFIRFKAASRMARLADPEPRDWISEPPPVVRPYHDTILGRATALSEEWRERNIRNELAYAYTEAAGDAEWEARTRRTLEHISRVTAQLLRILDDPEYRRQAARDPAFRADVGGLFAGAGNRSG